MFSSQASVSCCAGISPHTRDISRLGFTASWGAFFFICECDRSGLDSTSKHEFLKRAVSCRHLSVSKLWRAPWGWDSLARAPVTGRLKVWPTSAHTAMGQSAQRQTGRRRLGSPPEDVNDPDTKKRAGRNKLRQTNCWRHQRFLFSFQTFSPVASCFFVSEVLFSLVGCSVHWSVFPLILGLLCFGGFFSSKFVASVMKLDLVSRSEVAEMDTKH